MRGILSSPDRLTDPARLASFRRIFRWHGALGQRVASGDEPPSELDRIHAVPLVFGLVPTEAFVASRERRRIRPLLRAHLNELGVPADPELEAILKSIVDQFAATGPWLAGERFLRKKGLSSVRALGRYGELATRQAGRCAICGVRLDGGVEEQLDHAIPWRLVGDVLDGANWQVLCRECNVGKGSYFATVHAPSAWNWIYGHSDIESLKLQTRYVTLVQRARCVRVGCDKGPTDKALAVTRIVAGGLPVADNLQVLCEDHSDPGSDSLDVEHGLLPLDHENIEDI